MDKQRLPAQREEPTGNEKKLRKREQRLKERLQEAQQAQDNALERLRSAEARFRKRAARVQRLEGRVNIVDRQIRALNAPPSTVVTLIMAAERPLLPSKVPNTPEQVSVETPSAPIEEPADKNISGEETSTEMVAGEAEPQFLERFAAVDMVEAASSRNGGATEEIPSVPYADPILIHAREARAVAEAAEEAARIAIERAADVAAYLEQIGSARHLMQELELLGAEADAATALAQETENAALAAERRAAEKMTPASSTAEEQAGLEITPIADEVPAATTMPSEDTGNSEAALANETQPISKQRTPIEEIDEEEELVETVAAMIIADAAAIAAAEAEALAEASSARTREARAIAYKADQALAVVRWAMRDSSLIGDAAEEALKAAERDATHAHAALADAEAAEESAVNAAVNAEAEAEVAEGMAFAASDRIEHDEILREKHNSSARSTLANGATFIDMLELPNVRPEKA